MRPRLRAGGLVLVLGACGRETSIEDVTPPTTQAVVAPQLTSIPAGGATASWLEPRAAGGYAFRFSQYRRGGWSAPSTVVVDDSIYFHPTELPSVLTLGNGTLIAAWQRKAGRGRSRFESDILVARSSDSGVSWSPPEKPHRDPRGGEHGFPTLFARDDSTAGMVWLDSRMQTFVAGTHGDGSDDRYQGSMALLSTTVTSSGRWGPEVVVDSTTCECCPNSVAATPSGFRVVYRDKLVPLGTPAESLYYETNAVRDMAVAMVDSSRRSSPLHRDGWTINACPNNGPSVSAHGDRLVAAWWTAEGGRPRVQIAFSTDGGASFGAPIRVDADRGDGQVSVALLPGGAHVAWLERGRVHLRTILTDGRRSAAAQLGAVAGRIRLPAMVPLDGGRHLIGWLEGSPGTLRFRSAPPLPTS
jgi:hypothetical protein